MLSKIDIRCVITDHWNTLRNFKTKKISSGDILLFIGLPIVVMAWFLYKRVYITELAVTTLLACFSILTGLLFSILLLILDLVRKEKPEPDEHEAQKANRKLRAKLLAETFANISFCVLLAILLALISVAGIFDIQWLRIIVSGVIYFGSSNFVLTMLMVLKRIHVLLGTEVAEED